MEVILRKRIATIPILFLFLTYFHNTILNSGGGWKFINYTNDLHFNKYLWRQIAKILLHFKATGRGGPKIMLS